MIALDTNVVVRLLVEDDAAQTSAALRLVRRAREEGARLFIADVVVCEIAWVLRSCYAKSREEIADALDQWTTVDEAEFESPHRVASAIAAYRAGGGDLADYLMRESATGSGCAGVATFDRTLLKEPGFVQPDPSRWGADVSLREAAPPYVRRRGPRVRRRSAAGARAGSSASA